MNTVIDELNRIREVNMLSFTEITSDIYDHHDSYFAQYGARVESRIDIANDLLYSNGKVQV